VTEKIVLDHPDIKEVLQVNTAVVIISSNREVRPLAAVARAVAQTASVAGATAEATAEGAATATAQFLLWV
jgi:hypothetical protein